MHQFITVPCLVAIPGMLLSAPLSRGAFVAYAFLSAAAGGISDPVPVRQQDLATAMGVSPRSISIYLDELRTIGVVQTMGDPNSKHTLLYTLPHLPSREGVGGEG